MARRKRKRQQQSRTIPCFVFTLEMIGIAQEAMQLCEQSLQRTELLPPKMVFARETIQRVNDKFEAMRLSVDNLCLMTFDYNEKLVLAAAIRLYILDLLATPSTAQQEGKLKKSRQIERFALDQL